MAYWDEYEKRQPAKKAVAAARKKKNKNNMEKIRDIGIKAREEGLTYGQYTSLQLAQELSDHEAQKSQMKLKKAVNQLQTDFSSIDRDSRHLILCTLLYIQGCPHMDAAICRIKRYIRFGDGLGFHDLFLHLKEDHPARMEYAPYINGEKKIGDVFHKFGVAFLSFAENAGL